MRVLVRKRVRVSHISRYKNNGRLLTWSTKRCERCGKFLNKKRHRYCKNCAQKSYYLNSTWPYIISYTEKTIRKLTGLGISDTVRKWIWSK